MMHLSGLILLVFCLPAGSRRSMRVSDSHQDAQQQESAIANGLELSVEAREALIPNALRRGAVRRARPQIQSMTPLMSAGGKGFGGGEATRDPAPTVIDPNDPKGKQQAIHKAESFADYLARRSGGQPAAAAPAPAASAPAAPAYQPPAAPASGAFDIEDYGGVWGFDAKKAVFHLWDPEKPRSYTNFNPFERNDEGSMCDTNGCFPGQSRGYKSPLRPDQSWDIMQEEKKKMEELAKDPKFHATGKPGNFKLKWQDALGPPP